MEHSRIPKMKNNKVKEQKPNNDCVNEIVVFVVGLLAILSIIAIGWING